MKPLDLSLIPVMPNLGFVFDHCSSLRDSGMYERVLLEAFATGLPVVATSVGGTREIFAEPELEGLLAAPRDHDAIAQHVTRLLQHPDTCRTVSQLQRTIAVNRFSVTDCSQKLLQNYEATLQGRTAAETAKSADYDAFGENRS